MNIRQTCDSLAAQAAQHEKEASESLRLARALRGARRELLNPSGVKRGAKHPRLKAADAIHAAGYSYRQVADATGYVTNTISNVCSGSTKSAPCVRKIAEFLNLPFEELNQPASTS